MSSEKMYPPEDNAYYPAQGHNDACFIPESVRQYHGEPLYILVAWWCMQQRNWVNRCQISEAFRIPVQRASYLMAYVRNKTRRVIVESREDTFSLNSELRVKYQHFRVSSAVDSRLLWPGEHQSHLGISWSYLYRLSVITAPSPSDTNNHNCRAKHRVYRPVQ